MNNRRYILAAVSRLPHNRLRCLAYAFLGLRHAEHLRIGWKTVISAPTQCHLGRNVEIGGNCVVACGRFEVGGGTRILSDNQFIGNGTCVIGNNVRIIAEHYFDLAAGIHIGDNSWIAGRASQFWTHGTTREHTDQSICIGTGCYIASRVLFAPGAGVADGTLVALGAVVTRRFDEPHCVVAGCPAKIIRRNYDWHNDWV
ncbi:MAG: hypothetical protein WC708_05775 [Lentisphaeria bacterium]